MNDKKNNNVINWIIDNLEDSNAFILLLGPPIEKTTAGNPGNNPSTNPTPEIVTTTKITTIQSNTASYRPTEKPTNGNVTGNSAQPTTGFPRTPGSTDAPSGRTMKSGGPYIYYSSYLPKFFELLDMK